MITHTSRHWCKAGGAPGCLPSLAAEWSTCHSWGLSGLRGHLSCLHLLSLPFSFCASFPEALGRPAPQSGEGSTHGGHYQTLPEGRPSTHFSKTSLFMEDMGRGLVLQKQAELGRRKPMESPGSRRDPALGDTREGALPSCMKTQSQHHLVTCVGRPKK